MRFFTADTTQVQLTSRIDQLTLPLAPDEKTEYGFYGQYPPGLLDQLLG
jgi:hypothetical protein